MPRLGFGAMAAASHHPMSCSPSLTASLCVSYQLSLLILPTCLRPAFLYCFTLPLGRCAHCLPPLLLAEAAGVEQSAPEAAHPAATAQEALHLREGDEEVSFSNLKKCGIFSDEMLGSSFLFQNQTLALEKPWPFFPSMQALEEAGWRWWRRVAAPPWVQGPSAATSAGRRRRLEGATRGHV